MFEGMLESEEKHRGGPEGLHWQWSRGDSVGFLEYNGINTETSKIEVYFNVRLHDPQSWICMFEDPPVSEVG